MNESLRNKLSEVVGTNNISYILSNNNDFSVTGFKVMQNQNSTGLLRCAKIKYNGQIKLVYIVGGNKPLSYVATRLGVNEMNAVIFNLIQRVMDIKSNGFFKAENLELDFNKIFVNTSDYSVHFIYFPISSGATGKLSGFENEFRVALISLFNSFPVFAAPQFQRLCSDLANGSLPLDTIMKKLQDNFGVNNQNLQIDNRNYAPQSYSIQDNQCVSGMPVQNYGVSNHVADSRSYQVQSQFANLQYGNQEYQQPLRPVQRVQEYREAQPQHAQVQPQSQSKPQKAMTITSINSLVQITLTVNIPEYLIGKNPNMVNGAVTHNPAISRVHCKISYSSGRYYLTDMGSANGTFLNQQRLNPQQTVEVNNGDYLKLANSDFIISF